MPDATPLPSFGTRCESLVAGYLTGKGLVVRQRNWRMRLGEVDLICEDGPTIVFVEVKARHGFAFGPGRAAVGALKQRKLLTLARLYMRDHPERACRFDVVCVSFERDRPRIEHLVAAFP